METLLKDKTVILGVTGSIAAFKSAALCSALVKQGADVRVIMTKNACEFISPLTFEELSANRCVVDSFDRNFPWQVAHISLATKADLAIVAPCTANVLAKLACGIADDMLTTTLLACKCPILLAPAMNTAMYEAAVVQDNIMKLKNYGYKVIDPIEGRLACNTIGKGKMPEPKDLLEEILRCIAKEKTLAGKKVLVTAGATREAMDPVRFISNPSTGKMGCALAREAIMRGARLTLVVGDLKVEPPASARVIPAISAAKMLEITMDEAKTADIVIMCAAVSDYRPKTQSQSKLKKNEDFLNLKLEKTEDILMKLTKNRQKNQIICGFAMETENLLASGEEKLKRKNLDLIVANSLSNKDSGFAHDTNLAYIITATKTEAMPLMTKTALASEIWDRIQSL